MSEIIDAIVAEREALCEAIAPALERIAALEELEGHARKLLVVEPAPVQRQLPAPKAKPEPRPNVAVTATTEHRVHDVIKAGGGDVSTGDIMREVGIARGTVKIAIKRLVDKGLVRREGATTNTRYFPATPFSERSQEAAVVFGEPVSAVAPSPVRVAAEPGRASGALQRRLPQPVGRAACRCERPGTLYTEEDDSEPYCSKCGKVVEG